MAASAAGQTAFSLADRPALIETQFPVGRLSAETYAERMAVHAQTLTVLGSYWKGRKQLILVRAAVLGCLLPATDDPVADLRVFLLLLGIDDESFAHRFKNVKPTDIPKSFVKYGELIDDTPVLGWNGSLTIAERADLLAAWESDEGLPAGISSLRQIRPAHVSPDSAYFARLVAAIPRVQWREGLPEQRRKAMIGEWLATLPYDKRLDHCLRPEEVGEDLIGPATWDVVNAHLGTTARDFPDLIHQLGLMRFGRRPIVSDTFAGGGSIPFEAARIGCDVQASDLNPIACMLTWGAFNVIAADEGKRAEVERSQQSLARAVDDEFLKLGVETDDVGNRAKAYLYCLETTCPKTGWKVPMAPSWIISKKKRVVARLVPDEATKSYAIEVVADATADQMAAAALGTVRNKRLVHEKNPDREGVSISVIRGDYRDAEFGNRNRLRAWTKEDFAPREGDIFGERLYAIQWMEAGSLSGGRERTFYASVAPADLEREDKVKALVAERLAEWQRAGWVPDMPIAAGDKTDEPIRTRGWTHWHHLFNPRNLLLLATIARFSEGDPWSWLHRAHQANWNSRLCAWFRSYDTVNHVFENQSLRTLYDYGARSAYVYAYLLKDRKRSATIAGKATITNRAAGDVDAEADLFITDPPYADAVNYHEITEFFIAWLRKNPPPPFDEWVWDSQRQKAIKGADEHFRSEMATAYSAMSSRMPDNGMQVVMFTHQDAAVWADLATIMWAAGLRVTAAWNIVTETQSALKEGNYVQGTILLVLRKRLSSGNVKRMDIEGEIEEAVDAQLASMHALDDDWTAERLYTDGDLQLAAYAAALRVITSYASIDRREVGADIYRKLRRGERTVIRELIDYAASVANNKLVPEGCSEAMWRDLDPSSRFYVRMLDMESKGPTKFADYQDFARTFSVEHYAEMMGSTKANAASLAGAATMKARMLGGPGFGSSPLRRVLFAVYKTMQKDDPREGLAFLKTELGQDYWQMRLRLVELAQYVRLKTIGTRPDESEAADLVAQKLELDRV